MTGDRMAHPLLISLANISADFRMKSSNNTYMLLALLPVAKFLDRDKKVRSVLGARLAHACLDFVLRPLKIGAAIGIMMSDPLGCRRFCFTPLAAYMVDTEEAVMLAGVAGKTSHLTVASYKKFGDAFRHEPRTASLTLAQREAIRTAVDPNIDLKAYAVEAMKFRLNGVDHLFWRDWPGAEPSTFFTPESLHHWHKQFWDHDCKWSIREVGPTEIDFRFSILPYRIGFRQFKEGISKLKQVTGREHRDVERYLVAVIAGAVPREFLVAIRALMDFRYLAQAPTIDETTCQNIESALQEFHAHKAAILEAGARVGKANKPIDNWWIPKLEMMQSVVSNIRANGAPYQWSADITEHAHITEIKRPAKSGNNQNYDSQICRALDCTDKIRRFDLATSIRAAGIQIGETTTNLIDEASDYESDTLSGACDSEDEDIMAATSPLQVDTASALIASVKPTSALVGASRRILNYFHQADRLARGKHPQAPRPYRTFTFGSTTGFHLARDPSYKQMLVDTAAAIYCIPDLRPALADYVRRSPANFIIGGRRVAQPGCPLSFDTVQVWNRMRIQLKQYHQPNEVISPRTLVVSPPSDSDEWPVGHYDMVLVNVDPSKHWPKSGIEGMIKFLFISCVTILTISTRIGHCVAQLRLIMCVRAFGESTNSFVAYVQRFDIIPQQGNIRTSTRPDASSGLYTLKRSFRTDGSRLGDVIPLAHIRSPIQLVPRFGDKADSRLTMQTSLEFSTEFWLNKYETKEIFWSLHTT